MAATAAPPVPAEPATDRAPDALAAGTPEPLRGKLVALLGAERVLHRVSDLVRYASDSSPYRLIPQAVVMAHDAQDVAKVLAFGRAEGIPVTLRAGGTSLNGQAQGGGILVDVRRHFNGFRVSEDGARVRVKPGTVLGHVNRALVKHGRRVGPDPASTDFATVGGVIANNSGGMRCGVTADTYSTLRSLTFVLPSGTTIDTSAPDAVRRFAEAEPRLAKALERIRDEIRGDAELSERIRRKFAIKNTTGYRLCAFLDAEEPVEIFRRLLVGSEGTLAFIADAEFETVEHGRHTSTALLFFPNVDAAAAPVHALSRAGATAVELMVNATLIAAAWTLPGIPEAWRELPPDGAALLVEMRTGDPAELDALEAAALAALEELELLEPARFTRDREETETFWRVREGMQGTVAKVRPAGTAMIIEDVCVPPERVAESVRDLQALLGEHGFLQGVAGHASAGNLHFLLLPAFAEQSERDRYEAFMGGLVDLIVDKYDGSLKAEHGTGRNMAPYVEREWGAKATEIMWRIKRLADPDGVLNPDVLLSEDAGIHLRHLKTTPQIEDAGGANSCIECGFCEPVCPSRDLTTTPRQRIVLRREMARHPEGSPVREALLSEYGYDAEETCAADGTCALACPVGIDTGALIKDVRARSHTPKQERRALAAAKRWATVEKAARAGLRVGGVLGDGAMGALTGAARRASTEIPAWTPGLPKPAPSRLPETARAGAAAVYLPACLNRMMGTSRHGDGDVRWLPQALVDVSARAGLPVWIPPDAAGHCCGMPWSSKGFLDGHAHMTGALHESLRRWSDGGKLPVVIDATSCTQGAIDGLEGVEVLDAVAWAARLVPHLEIVAPLRSATVHPTCSTRHLGLTATLEALTGAFAEEVVVPIVATCCGMAGDRGLLHPELPASATRAEAAEVRGRAFDAHVSANRTCEIALEQATGSAYASPVQLLERATRPSV